MFAMLTAMDDPPAPLHRRLRAARLMAGYESAQDLADASLIPGINNRNSINQLETGKIKPSPEQLIGWARATKLPVEWFFTDWKVLVPREVPDDPYALLDELKRRIQGDE